MRSRLVFLMLSTTAIVTAPVLGQTEDAPAGMWKGTVVRNGVAAPIVVRLMQKEGLWEGRADVDGSASPLTKVQVAGDRVRFAVKGEGTFDGTLSKDAFAGSISGSKKGPPGSFSLTRQEESMARTAEMIDSAISKFGP
jgi:hypothetical protein